MVVVTLIVLVDPKSLLKYYFYISWLLRNIVYLYMREEHRMLGLRFKRTVDGGMFALYNTNSIAVYFE